MRVTTEDLRMLNACGDQVETFADEWPNGVEVTGDSLRRAVDLGLDIDWWAVHAFADYRAKLAPIYADYRAKRAPIYADYEAKRAPIDADFDAKRAAIDAEYQAKRIELILGFAGNGRKEKG